MQRTIKALAKEGVPIKEVCSDAAGYSFELMEWLDKSRRRFYIRARKSPAMERQMKEIDQWHPVKDKEHLLYQWAETTWKGYRLIVQRQQNADGQTDVFSGTAYTYRAIITNDRRKKSHGLFVIHHYNKRGGIERNFDIVRNDFGWALMPFDNMSENTAYLLLTALCLNLFEWAKKLLAARTSLLGTTAIRVKNFLLRFASVPAQWVKTGRQLFLKLYTHRDSHGPFGSPVIPLNTGWEASPHGPLKRVRGTRLFKRLSEPGIWLINPKQLVLNYLNTIVY
ncbi:MAG: transposase [Owenweeksia sp.]|nr:transposase [Owenweeksia sp.]